MTLYVRVPRDYRGNEHPFDYRVANLDDLHTAIEQSAPPVWWHRRLGHTSPPCAACERGLVRSLIAPKAELPDDYRLPSTAPIPENPDAWVEAPEPERNEADIIADLDFAGVEHRIQWCVAHDYNVRPGAENCYAGFEWGEPCNVVDAMLRLRPE